MTAKNIAGESRSAVYLRIKDGPFDEDDAPIFLRRLNDLAVKVGTRTRFLVEIRSSSDVKVSGGQSARRLRLLQYNSVPVNIP